MDWSSSAVGWSVARVVVFLGVLVFDAWLALRWWG